MDYNLNLEQHRALGQAEAGAKDAHNGADAPLSSDYWYRVGFFIARGTDPESALRIAFQGPHTQN